MKRAVVFFGAAAVALSAVTASAVTRQEVITRGKAYAAHPWRSTAANMHGTCEAPYVSLFNPGDYVGLPYNWGGYVSLFDFDQQIKSGMAAGAQPSGDLILDCTTGVDCSGFVSKAWGAGHFTTSTIPETSSAITVAQMLPGDVFNMAGYHVAMYTHTLANGEPAMVEAYGYNVHVNVTTGFSHVKGYTPRKYSGITGTTVADPAGTPTKPIEIKAFPYTHAGDTSASSSVALGGCGLAPSTSEDGPEVVYTATFTQPGTLTVTSSDDASADIDVELFAHLTTNECVARNDSTFTQTVGCGTYYIVADTYGSGGNAGAYTLNATFTPSGQPCSAVPGPPAFTPKGKLGDACAYPGHDDLPFCNENLGSSTCLYGKSSSYCSIPCANDADCAAMPGGGCCEDISGKGELYCLMGAACTGGSSSGSSGSSGSSSGDDGSSGSSGSSGATGDGADPGGSGDAAGGPTMSTQPGGCATTPRSGGGWAAAGALAFFGAMLASRRRRL